MVVRTRLNGVLRQLALCAAAGGAIAYLGLEAYRGDHGMLAQHQYEQQKQQLSDQLAALEAQRASLDHKVSLLRADTLDPDMLEDKAREMLGEVNASDVVVMAGGAPASP